MIDYTYVELTSACTTALAEFRKQVCPPCTSCVHHVTCSMLNRACTNPNPNPIWFQFPNHRAKEVRRAITRGVRFVAAVQRNDGSW